LAESLRETEWWRIATRCRVEAEVTRLECLLKRFSTACAEDERRVKSLLTKYLQIVKKPATSASIDELRTTLREARAGLQKTVRAFERGPMKDYMPQEHVLAVLTPDLASRVRELGDRFVALRAAATRSARCIDDATAVRKGTT